MEAGDRYGDFVIVGDQVKFVAESKSGRKYVKDGYYMRCALGGECTNEKRLSLNVISQGASKTCRCNPKMAAQRLAAVAKAREVQKRRHEAGENAPTGFLDEWFAKIQQEAKQAMAIKQMRRV